MTENDLQGFGRNPRNTPPRAVPPARPTPLPRRPQGSWFVGLVLTGISLFAGYELWQTFFRFSAYGVVDGRTLQISSPWEGTVREVHARAGDRIRRGQLLVTVENRDLQHRQAQLTEEFQLAQASLAAEVAKLRWQSASQVVDRGGLVIAEYFETEGRLLQEQAHLSELERARDRAAQLLASRIITNAEFEKIHFAHQGQQGKVDMLGEAMEELRQRKEQAGRLLNSTGLGSLFEQLTEQGADQLQPHVLRMQALQAELARNQARLAQCEVTSSLNGLVMKIARSPGERCKIGEPLLVILEEESLEVVLYFPQHSSAPYEEGQQLNLNVAPYFEPVTCTLLRQGDQLVPAPDPIKRHYAADQRLLPIHLKPDCEQAQKLGLKMGSVVMLPLQVIANTPGPHDAQNSGTLRDFLLRLCRR